MLECTLCKLQYVGKCETTSKIRLNKQRKNEKRSDGIPASTFSYNRHDFQFHAKLNLMERLNKLNIDKKHYESDLKPEKTFGL